MAQVLVERQCCAIYLWDSIRIQTLEVKNWHLLSVIVIQMKVLYFTPFGYTSIYNTPFYL